MRPVVQQASLDRHLAHASPVHPRAIVGERQHHPRPELLGGEEDAAGPWLAPALSEPRGLDAVVDGVADKVHERIAQLLDDQLVDLRLGARDDQAHLLVEIAAGTRAACMSPKR